MPALTVTGSDI